MGGLTFWAGGGHIKKKNPVAEISVQNAVRLERSPKNSIKKEEIEHGKKRTRGRGNAVHWRQKKLAGCREKGLPRGAAHVQLSQPRHLDTPRIGGGGLYGETWLAKGRHPSEEGTYGFTRKEICLKDLGGVGGQVEMSEKKKV